MTCLLKDNIVERYGKSVLKRSALRINNGESVFREILGSGRYRKILEIGTYKGASAAYMAQFCDCVMTFDLREGQLENHDPTWDRKAFWQSLGIDNIELYLVNDDLEKYYLISYLEFDFAFIDGAHDERVVQDFEMVKHCGAVLFHDYDEKQKHIKSLVDSLPKDEVTIFGIFALWRRNERS